MATCVATERLHTFCALSLMSTIAILEINNHDRKSKKGKLNLN